MIRVGRPSSPQPTTHLTLDCDWSEPAQVAVDSGLLEPVPPARARSSPVVERVRGREASSLRADQRSICQPSESLLLAVEVEATQVLARIADSEASLVLQAGPKPVTTLPLLPKLGSIPPLLM
jgi:hypothetical protein